MLSNGDAAFPRTNTLNVQLLVLPEESVAIAVTRFVPTGNEEPLAGVTTRLVTPQLSLAPGSEGKFTTTAQAVGELVIISTGQLIIGFSVSITVTVKLHVAVLLLASVTRKLF